MFLSGLDRGPSGLDPLLLLLMALILDVALGPTLSARRLTYHPLNGLGELVGWLDRKLNREHRSAVDRAGRGAVVVLVLAVLAGAVGWILALLARIVPNGFLLELLALVFLVDQRAVHEQVRRVAAALGRENLGLARAELAAVSGADDARMDGHAVARTAVEISARSFAYGVVAPTFWYAVFGLPGLCVLRAVAVIDDVVGEPSDRHRAFGFAAARLNEVMVLIPVPLAGAFLLVASVFVPTVKPGRAARAMVTAAGSLRTRVMSWPLRVMAGALGLALAAPRRPGGGAPHSPWIDAGTARASPLDVRRALFLFSVACLINGAAVAALAVARLV